MKKLLMYSLVFFCASCGNTENTEPKLSDFCGQIVRTHNNYYSHTNAEHYLGFLQKNGNIIDVRVGNSTFEFYKDGDIIICDSTKN